MSFIAWLGLLEPAYLDVGKRGVHNQYALAPSVLMPFDYAFCGNKDRVFLLRGGESRLQQTDALLISSLLV